jgi:hypothetical protein
MQKFKLYIGVYNTLFSIILFFVLFGNGCKKTENNPTTPTTEAAILEDDASDIIASSVSGSAATNGMSSNLEDAAILASGGTVTKPQNGIHIENLLIDTTITRSHTGIYTYNFLCRFVTNFPSPNSMNLFLNIKGTYDFPRITGKDSIPANILVENIIGLSPNYKLTGSYNRLAMCTLKVRNKQSLSTILNVTIDSVYISKATKKIQSGTAHLTFMGQSSTGKTFSFTATLTFISSTEAVLLINGKQYNINLLTGEATKVS